MDLASAKMIGAGLASIALIGAGVGIGIIFGNYLSGALRNPGAAAGGALSVISIAPLAAIVAVTALEFLIAFLQAYVFAILTCIYLNDALNLHDH